MRTISPASAAVPRGCNRLRGKAVELSSYEAVQKLATDFGLDSKPPTAVAFLKPKRLYIRQEGTEKVDIIAYI